MTPPPQPDSVAVIGLGYVGSVTAACLASLGHPVTGVDRDPLKVRCLLEGRAPFFEPGLDPLIAAGRASGLLNATTDLAAALESASIALLCVGTPSAPDGDLALTQLQRVCASIAPCLPARSTPLILAVRSTVFPGTCEDVVLPALGHHPLVSVVANPEFLREGCAVQDFLEPSLLVVGSSDPAAGRRVAALYERLPVAPCLVPLRTAELVKYSTNAFHALKIAFANEIGALSSALAIDGAAVMDILCQDTKLNLSPAYLRPGFAFGGSCLPKDLRTLNFRASALGCDTPLLRSLLPANAAHLQRALHSALAFSPSGRTGVYGLAFKENTDDLRESPVIALLHGLLLENRDLLIFDPHIQLGSIYGANRDFLLNALPGIEARLAPSLDALLQADRIIIAQRPTPEDLALLKSSGRPLLHLTTQS